MVTSRGQQHRLINEYYTAVSDKMTNSISTKSLFTLTTVVLCLLIQTSAFAGVYKWTDENGQVHYGEKPGNTQAEKIFIRENETTTPRSIKSDKEGEGDQDAAKDKEQKDTKAAEPKMVPAPISNKEKRRLCNEAKSDYATISSRGRMREINSKGEYIYLTEGQRQQRLSAAKKKSREYCR
jgi:hypothetical protein